jgi:dTDP-4-amino-4,6-dideoxygalactose transaminase
MSDEGYELEYVKEAFTTNWIAPLGPNVSAFEREFAERIGTCEATALVSGTSAIHLALKLFGVGDGIRPNDPDARDPRDDVVLCPSLTFVASVNPIVYQHATPVLIDSDWSTWNMDPRALKIALDKYGEKVKVVIVVHLYGLLADIDQILALCDEYEVPVIEDAAESLGTTYDAYYYRAEGESKRRWHDTPKRLYAGTASDVGCFSFNGNKIITTSGGGMLTGNNPDTAKEFCAKARFWATQSRADVPWYQHEEIGYNYRMSNVLAGIGLAQLKVLDRHIERKRAIFEYYKEHLETTEKVHMMPVPEEVYSNFWLSCVTFDDPGKPAEVYAKLDEERIEARPIWKPMHMQSFYRHCDFITAQSEGSMGEELFGIGLCLPSDINMCVGELERVVMVVRSSIT